MAEELISLKEAQEYLGVSNVKMWKLVKEGNLPIYTDPLDKRKKLVPKATVEKLKQPKVIAKKETPARPPKLQPKAKVKTTVEKSSSIPLSEAAKMKMEELVQQAKPEQKD